MVENNLTQLEGRRKTQNFSLLFIQFQQKLFSEGIKSDNLHIAGLVEELHQHLSKPMVDFWAFLSQRLGPSMSVLSVRDLRAWCNFIVSTYSEIGHWAAFVHGAHMVFLDGIGLGLGMPEQV